MCPFSTSVAARPKWRFTSRLPPNCSYLSHSPPIHRDRIEGVNFHSEDLLRDASPVQQAAALGMVSFVWGDDLDTRENIDFFKKQLRVNGIIYDR